MALGPCPSCGTTLHTENWCNVCGPVSTALPMAPGVIEWPTPASGADARPLHDEIRAALKLGASAADSNPSAESGWQPGKLQPPGYRQGKELKQGKVWELHRISDGHHLVGKFYSEALDRQMLAQLEQACNGPGGGALTRVVENGPVPAHVNQVSRYYSVEEFAEHGTLRSLMSGLPLPEKQARMALRQIAEGLHALHSAGLIHRDIKPENVLCTEAAPLTLKLTDFELMRHERGLEAETRLVEGLYMTPERLTGQYTLASEWWGVGMILYELVTGSHAFATGVLAANRGSVFSALSKASPIAFDRAPPAWRVLLRGLLTRVSATRWGFTEIDRFLNGQPLPEPPNEFAARAQPPRVPMIVGDVVCRSREEIAAECARHWTQASAELLANKRLADWLNDHGDGDRAAKVERLRHDGVTDADVKTLSLMLLLDDQIAPTFRQTSVAPKDLIALARKALTEEPMGADGAPICRLLESLHSNALLAQFSANKVFGGELARAGEQWPADTQELARAMARISARVGNAPSTMAHAHQLAYVLLARIDADWLRKEIKRLGKLNAALAKVGSTDALSKSSPPGVVCAVACLESAIETQYAKVRQAEHEAAVARFKARAIRFAGALLVGAWAPAALGLLFPEVLKAPSALMVAYAIGVATTLATHSNSLRVGLAAAFVAIAWYGYPLLQQLGGGTPPSSASAATAAEPASDPVSDPASAPGTSGGAADAPPPPPPAVAGPITTDRMGPISLGMTPLTVERVTGGTLVRVEKVGSACDWRALERSQQQLRFGFVDDVLVVLSLGDDSMGTLSGVKIGTARSALEAVYGDRLEVHSRAADGHSAAYLFVPKDDPRVLQRRVLFSLQRGRLVSVAIGSLADVTFGPCS